MTNTTQLSQSQLIELKSNIRSLAIENGFADLKVSDINTAGYFKKFKQWVNDGLHGSMSFLERNQSLRENPAELHPETCRVLALRYDYLPENAAFAKSLSDPNKANISRYALGRDYHKLMRKKLNLVINQLKQKLNNPNNFANLSHRVLVDSAPVLETAFAEKSGLGWQGKHSLIINESAGSWFFLGEIFINLPLPVDAPVKDLCGSCTACISLCPTDAILNDKIVDARRCISYLTIENNHEIPKKLRPLLGNRIYGCDDCQLACPWNRFAPISQEKDFLPRNQLNNITLEELWEWNEETFLNKLQGSPIRRIGYQNWLRNLSVAMGNSGNKALINPLKNKREIANQMVKEHIDWAIEQLENSMENTKSAKLTKLIRTVNTMLPRDC